MADAQIFLENDSGIQIFPDPNPKMVLLGKNSTPTGTVFTAKGQSTTYAFGYPQLPTSSYGWVIFGEDGRLLFDAIKYGKMARPVDTMTGNFTSATTQSWSKTLPSGKTYAVAMMEDISSYRVINIPTQVGPGNITYAYAFQDQETVASVSGNTVTVNATRYTPGGQQGAGSIVPYEEAGHIRWRALILDVSNF